MSYPSPASTSDKIKVDSFAFRNTGVCWLVKKDGQPVNLCTKTLSVGDMVVFPRPRWRGTDRMDRVSVSTCHFTFHRRFAVESGENADEPVVRSKNSERSANTDASFHVPLDK